MREYYEQLHSKTHNNLDKINKFLERQLLKLTQVETETMNRFISKNEIELLNTLPTKATKNPPNSPDLGGFTGEFYQIFKKEIIPIQYKLFQKVEQMEKYFQLISWNWHPPVPKSEADIVRKENCRPVFLMNTYAKGTDNIFLKVLFIYF